MDCSESQAWWCEGVDATAMTCFQGFNAIQECCAGARARVMARGQPLVLVGVEHDGEIAAAIVNDRRSGRGVAQDLGQPSFRLGDTQPPRPACSDLFHDHN